MSKSWILGFIIAVLSLPILAAPREIPRVDTREAIGLDQDLSTGEDLVPNAKAFAAIKALILGTVLPDQVSDSDAKIILRSALKSGALGERGRFRKQFDEVFQIRKFKEEFLKKFYEAHENNKFLRRVAKNGTRYEFENFLYLFLIMVRTADIDLGQDMESVYDKLQLDATVSLMKMAKDFYHTSINQEAKAPVVQSLVQAFIEKALSLEERTSDLTPARRLALQRFFRQFAEPNIGDRVKEKLGNVRPRWTNGHWWKGTFLATATLVALYKLSYAFLFGEPDVSTVWNSFDLDQDPWPVQLVLTGICSTVVATGTKLGVEFVAGYSNPRICHDMSQWETAGTTCDELLETAAPEDVMSILRQGL